MEGHHLQVHRPNQLRPQILPKMSIDEKKKKKKKKKKKIETCHKNNHNIDHMPIIIISGLK